MTALMFVIGAVMLTAMAYAYSRMKHPYLTAAKSAATGLSALFMVNVFSKATGCYIAVNTATVFVVTVLSLPGVVALLLMKIIFGY